MTLETADEEVYWLALSLLNKKIEPNEVEKVHRRLGSIKRIWDSRLEDLETYGFSRDTLPRFEKLRSTVNLKHMRITLDKFRKSRTKIIHYQNSHYPMLLKGLKTGAIHPPFVLFHQGNFLDFNRCVAIVGTRNLSFNGYMMARRFAKAIAKSGFTVVTGLARGTDAIANRAALEVSSSRTIAVLPWMEPLYPPEHGRLAKEIQKRGAIISENFDKESVRAAHIEFVERNRLTSGISQCLVAIESEEKGGTVHQVTLALTQGKKVFAVKPQMTQSDIARGYRLFVEKGATSVTKPEQVLKYLAKSEPLRHFDDYIRT